MMDECDLVRGTTHRASGVSSGRLWSIVDHSPVSKAERFTSQEEAKLEL